MAQSEGNYVTSKGRTVKTTERMTTYMKDRDETKPSRKRMTYQTPSSDIDPGDSVSQCSGVSHTSRSSAILRLKEEQRRAELEARAAALKDQHEMTINKKLAQTQMRLEKERLDHEMEISELRFHTMEKELELKTEIAVSNARTLAIDRHDERSGSSIQLSYQPPLLFDHQPPSPMNRQPLVFVENRTSPVAPVYEHATTHVAFRPPQGDRHPLNKPINHSTPLNPQATPFSHIDQSTLSGVHEILKTLNQFITGLLL